MSNVINLWEHSDPVISDEQIEVMVDYVEHLEVERADLLRQRDELLRGRRWDVLAAAVMTSIGWYLIMAVTG